MIVYIGKDVFFTEVPAFVDVDKLRQEFAGKTNHEAYDLAFTKRLLRPDPSAPGSYLGNTQRQEFLPQLKKLALPPEAQVFDIGAGSGEIIETAFATVNDATINLIEPNPVLLSKYCETLKNYPNLKLGISHCGPFEDYYPSSNKGALPIPSRPQHLILAIHMLYHFTDPKATRIDPDADIEQAVRTMFQFLAPGGCIFLVFANQLISATGHAGRYYFDETGQSEIAKRLLLIGESRVRLLDEGQIVTLLDKSFGNGAATVESITTPSCIYGDCEEDIAAMCITAEIGEINEDPFDLKKLEICARFVDTHREVIGLTVEQRDIPQKGMIRANQPQIISIIRKSPECVL